MDYTDHIMLVGAGAKKFALEMGFKEQNLLTEESRMDWLRWKSRLNSTDNWLDLPPKTPPAQPTRPRDPEDGGGDHRYLHVYHDSRGVPHTYGTINMNVVTSTGDIASVTTTSGLSWKIPGRIGDSPIIGAGQYCDNDVGAAGATGIGENVMRYCGSFLIVELMRQGLSPQDACVEVIRRIARKDPRGFDLSINFVALNKAGAYGAAGTGKGFQFSVATNSFSRIQQSIGVDKA
jgi:N4-(beta-N-acetylglucosaminyl)-L-asparaginase